MNTSKQLLELEKFIEISDCIKYILDKNLSNIDRNDIYDLIYYRTKILEWVKSDIENTDIYNNVINILNSIDNLLNSIDVGEIINRKTARNVGILSIKYDKLRAFPKNECYKSAKLSTIDIINEYVQHNKHNILISLLDLIFITSAYDLSNKLISLGIPAITLITIFILTVAIVKTGILLFKIIKTIADIILILRLDSKSHNKFLDKLISKFINEDTILLLRQIDNGVFTKEIRCKDRVDIAGSLSFNLDDYLKRSKIYIERFGIGTEDEKETLELINSINNKIDNIRKRIRLSTGINKIKACVDLELLYEKYIKNKDNDISETVKSIYRIGGNLSIKND